MRFFLTTLGAEPWHADCLEQWRAMHMADTVGRHEVVTAPEDAERLLFVDLQQHPEDPYLRQLRKHPLVRQFPTKTFVYDQRDRPVRSLPGMYVSARRPRLRRHDSIVGGPYPQRHNDVEVPVAEPDLLWTFWGARTHPVRERILALPVEEPDALRDTSRLPVFEPGRDEATVALMKVAYARMIARSRYVICPRGHGPSSFRLYETLAAGRVPVIISDDWLPPPRVDWEACSLRLRERDAPDLVSILQQQSEASWRSRSAEATRVWQENFCRERIWDYVAESIRQLPSTAPRLPWFGQPDAIRLAASGLLARVRSLRAPRPSGSK